MTKFEIGRAVLYIPYHAAGRRDHPDVERGVVTGFNKTVVFVRFGSELHAKACYPDTIEYEVAP